MATLARLTFALAACAATQAALAPPVTAQDTGVRRLPDSVYQRLGCGTYGPILQRRDGSRAVSVALGRMSTCPEGPEVLANLWKDVTPATDSVYVGNLVSVSSILHRGVADGMLRALANRSLPTTVRIWVLGGLLQQLTGNLGPGITIGVAWRTQRLDSIGRPTGPVDSVLVARFAQSDGPFRPSPIEATLRAEILAAIARIAADPSEEADLRIAARDVHAELSRLYAGRSPS